MKHTVMALCIVLLFTVSKACTIVTYFRHLQDTINQALHGNMPTLENSTDR